MFNSFSSHVKNDSSANFIMIEELFIRLPDDENPSCDARSIVPKESRRRGARMELQNLVDAGIGVIDASTI